MAYARPELIEEPAALAARLDDADLRIVDATVFLVPAERGYEVLRVCHAAIRAFEEGRSVPVSEVR